MTETIITSETQFREELKKTGIEKGDLLYRGQADASWAVNCSAVRRLERDLVDPNESRLTNSLLVGYLEFLNAKARTRNVLPHGFDTDSPDLELLALLQHQGAATGLIDFTFQPFVALWFACNGSQKEDGAVYLLSRASTTEISDRKDIERPLASLYEKGVLWSWEPSELGDRIRAQSSVFVFGVAEVGEPAKMRKFIVPAQSKRDILLQLEELHELNEESLFPDFPGFAVANASDKSFNPIHTVSYWRAMVTLATTNEGRAEAHYNCGVAFKALRDSESAIAHYDMSISFDPDNAKAFNNRGVAKKSLGRHREAIADYEEAILLDPKYVVAYNNRGNAKKNLGQYEEAIADYDEAINLNPEYVEAYRNRGNSNLTLQRYGDAISDCNRALGIEPRYADLYHIRGDAKRSLGKIDEAIDDYSDALRYNPRNAKTYNNRGCARALRRQFHEAIEDFKEALRIEPSYMEARRHLKQAQILAQDEKK